MGEKTPLRERMVNENTHAQLSTSTPLPATHLPACTPPPHTQHLLTPRLIDTHALLDTTPGLNYDARATRRSNEKSIERVSM